MHLFINTMDAVLVECASDGRVRLENEDWSTPTLQEIRVIIHAAQTAIEELTERIETLEMTGST